MTGELYDLAGVYQHYVFIYKRNEKISFTVYC